MYHPNHPSKFEETVSLYKAWHQYVTTKLQVEVIELEFPFTQA